MKKYHCLIVIILLFDQAQAIAPREKTQEGEVESFFLKVPHGESFSKTRENWFKKAAEICGGKEFKVMQYIERTTSYGDALTLNETTGEYETPEFPPNIWGTILCIKNS